MRVLIHTIGPKFEVWLHGSNQSQLWRDSCMMLILDRPQPITFHQDCRALEPVFQTQLSESLPRIKAPQAPSVYVGGKLLQKMSLISVFFSQKKPAAVRGSISATSPRNFRCVAMCTGYKPNSSHLLLATAKPISYRPFFQIGNCRSWVTMTAHRRSVLPKPNNFSAIIIKGMRAEPWSSPPGIQGAKKPRLRRLHQDPFSLFIPKVGPALSGSGSAFSFRGHVSIFKFLRGPA